MENIEVLNKKTTELNRLINSNDSGKNAWRAGATLNQIKETKEFSFFNCNSFGEYTQQKLSISETRANGYITIYKSFSDESFNDNILVTHLLTLAKADQNIREVILEGIKKINIEKTVKDNIIGKVIANKPFHTNDIISTTIELLKSAKSNKLEINTDLAVNALELAKEQNFDRGTSYKVSNKHGKPFSSIYFENVCKVFPYKPTCEMDVVGLFCTIFIYLKEIPFRYSGQTLLVSFDHIVYLRAAFPDAQVKLNGKKKDDLMTIDIEFEFKSSSYFSHLNSEKTCHMIVCWENNIYKLEYDKFKYKIPPILSLKNVLETGKIALE